MLHSRLTDAGLLFSNDTIVKLHEIEMHDLDEPVHLRVLKNFHGGLPFLFAGLC